MIKYKVGSAIRLSSFLFWISVLQLFKGLHKKRDSPGSCLFFILVQSISYYQDQSGQSILRELRSLKPSTTSWLPALVPAIGEVLES